MVQITAKLDVATPRDSIWEIVSDVDNDVKYWKGLDSINNIRKEANVVERDVKVGFMGSKGHQIVKLYPKDSIEQNMTKGPVKGSRLMKLIPVDEGLTRIEVSWNFEFSGVPIFARAFVKFQLEEATKEALERIAKQARTLESAKNVAISQVK